MKYILLPIHPEWCCKIMNGDKETEVRRGTALYNAIDRLIKEQGKAPCLIYCTKGQPYLWKFWFDGDDECGYCYETSFAKDEYSPQVGEILNGKVVAQFEVSAEVIEVATYPTNDSYLVGHDYFTKTLLESELLEKSCLSGLELYLKGCRGTAISIHNLKIFDKPKELKEFHYHCKHKDLDCEECAKLRVEGKLKDKPYCHYGTSIERAPQSWCYAEVEE